MKSRRSFIQELSAGIAIPGLVSFKSSSQITSNSIDQSLKGEEVWEGIRQQFPLTSNRVYLKRDVGPITKIGFGNFATFLY